MRKRKVMIAVTGMAALCIHSAVHTIHEEIRRVSHEYEEARFTPNTPDNQERLKQLRAQLDQLAYDRISALCERLRERCPLDSRQPAELLAIQM